MKKLDQLGRCRFMDRSEFADGCNYLKGKKIVIVGHGAQGLKPRFKYATRVMAHEKRRDKGSQRLSRMADLVKQSVSEMNEGLPKKKTF